MTRKNVVKVISKIFLGLIVFALIGGTVAGALATIPMFISWEWDFGICLLGLRAGVVLGVVIFIAVFLDTKVDRNSSESESK